MKVQEKTDWNAYYEKPYFTASYSRKILQNQFVRYCNQYLSRRSDINVAELGGANSCYYDCIQQQLIPTTYLIIDNNEIGLNKLRVRITLSDSNVTLMNTDVLNFNVSEMKEKFDFVYSIGLIEHFSTEGTIKAVKSHFDLLKVNGIAIITFPTPIFLYLIIRFFAEKLGLWIFYDERPLKIEEVTEIIENYGKVLDSKIMWSMLLTQAIIVAKKKNIGSPCGENSQI